jgi:hypothetical protein
MTLQRLFAASKTNGENLMKRKRNHPGAAKSAPRPNEPDSIFGQVLKKAWENPKTAQSPANAVKQPAATPLPVKPTLPQRAITGAPKPLAGGSKPTPQAQPQKADALQKLKEFMRQRHDESLQSVNPVRVQLGIDLGTGYSKVVWRYGENAFPLCFGSNESLLSDYLVPSLVVFADKTMLTGLDGLNGNAAPSGKIIPNFKVCLACESAAEKTCNIRQCTLSNWRAVKFSSAEMKGQEVAFVTAFFLAKLLARTKELVLRQLENQGLRKPIPVKWMATLCVPDKYAVREEMLANSSVAKAFDEVFKIAWLMAYLFTEKPDLKNSGELLAYYRAACALRKELESGGPAFDLFIYPEIGAEMASITKSRTSEEGLYAFVDVGAGTVDASVFRFFRDGGEANRAPYAANVFQLGAAHIETRANRSFNPVQWLKKGKEKYCAPSKSERGTLLQDIIVLLSEASEKIEAEAKARLKENFREAFDKECDVDRWQELKLVLGGGGTQLKAYRKASADAFTLHIGPKEHKSPTIINLPKPDDFQIGSLLPAEFHRFAVAYGLSHQIVDLPEIVASEEVTPLSEMPRREYVDQTKDD